MKPLFTLLILVLMVSAAQAESISIIQLRNRPAAEVIPIVEPMLGAGDAISGQGFKIFLRSSSATLAQVRDMIKALDIASKTLLVSVFQGSRREISQRGISGNITLESGDARVSAGTGRSNNGNAGGSITYGANNARGTIKGTDSRIRQSVNPVHRVRVAEGTEAYIETGEQLPFFAGTSANSQRGLAGGVEFKDVKTGFYVLPRIHGDSVTLQVSPFKNSRKNNGVGNIETQSASTTITGRIGEWLLVGGVTGQVERQQSGIGSRVSSESRNNSSIWIRADLVR